MTSQQSRDNPTESASTPLTETAIAPIVGATPATDGEKPVIVLYGADLREHAKEPEVAARLQRVAERVERQKDADVEEEPRFQLVWIGEDDEEVDTRACTVEELAEELAMSVEEVYQALDDALVEFEHGH